MTNEEARDYIEKWKTDYSVDAKDREVLSMAIKALEIVNDFETAQIITGGRLNGRTYAYKCGLADGQRLAKDEKILEQQPCEDCISRDAVNTLIDELARAISDERCFVSKGVVPRGRETSLIMRDILDLPSVTPKAGRWEWVQYDSNPNIGNWHCSECGTIIPHMPVETDRTPIYKWCPMCGAKMAESEEEE